MTTPLSSKMPVRAWPFGSENPSSEQFFQKTGLRMPSGTARLAQVDQWVDQLTPAQRLEVLRTGGPLYVVESTMEAVQREGGVLGHRRHFTKDERKLEQDIRREIGQSSHHQLSLGYANLASSSVTLSHQPVLERMMRLELTKGLLEREFGGKLELGDE